MSFEFAAPAVFGLLVFGLPGSAVLSFLASAGCTSKPSLGEIIQDKMSSQAYTSSLGTRKKLIKLCLVGDRSSISL